METGPIIALLSAVCIAAGMVFVRKGVSQTGESFSAVLLSIFTGTLLFLFWLLFTGEWSKIWSLSWQGFVLLGAGGITHFVVGRLLGYDSIRLIGANRATAIIRTNVFFAVAFGVLFLNESLTVYLIAGALCIAGGATLVSVQRERELSKLRAKGVLLALAGGFFWGTSGVIIKPAIVEIGSPLAATFISHVAASIVIATLLFRKGQREQLVQLRRASLIPLVISGIAVAISHLLRYTAFSYSPVSVVQPLIGTIVLFTFLFSFLLNRSLEVFTGRVFIGMAMTVLGTFLLFQ